MTRSPTAKPQLQSAAHQVFVSYSRKDSAFANRLANALREHGLNIYLDTKDIAAGENWQGRLTNLILASETVLFIVSPDSLNSQICAWELSESSKMGKRIVPVMSRRVADAQLPKVIERLNYLSFHNFGFFRRASKFAAAVVKLKEALDLQWLRQQARLAQIAIEWAKNGRPDDMCLRGADLAFAHEWLNGSLSSRPSPSEQEADFIGRSLLKQSEELAADRSVGVELVEVLPLDANKSDRPYVAEAETALYKRVLSHWRPYWGREQHQYAGDGFYHIPYTLMDQVLGLCFLGNTCMVARINSADSVGIYLLDGEGAPPHFTSRFLKTKTDGIKRGVISSDGNLLAIEFEKTVEIWDVNGQALRFRLDGHELPILRSVFNRDGHRLLSISEDGTARLWDTDNGKCVVQIMRADRKTWAKDREQSGDSFDRSGNITFSPDGSTFLTTLDDAQGRIWDSWSGLEIALLNGHGAKIWNAEFDREATCVVTTSEDGTARLWDARSGKMLKIFKEETAEIRCASISKDGQRVVTGSMNGNTKIWACDSGALIGQHMVTQGPLTGEYANRVQFIPHGTRILTVAQNKYASDKPNKWEYRARLLDAESGRELVAFTPQPSQDTDIKYFQFETFNETGSLAAFRMSSGGTRNHPGTTWGELSVWPIFADTTQLTDYAKRAIKHALSPEQRAGKNLNPIPPRWYIENGVEPYNSQESQR
jgi:hypothetical protein